MLEKDVSEILVSGAEIDEMVERIAADIDRDYETSVKDGKKLLLLGILKGSIVFMGDLMKKITLPVEIDFMKVSSYGTDAVSSGRVNILLDIRRPDISECDVLIVEDIIDSGRTLAYLCEYLKLNGAHSVKTCTLLDKPSRREVNFCPDYCGRQIPDEFVVGYGLDYAERYRTLPFVGILRREIYECGS